MISRFSSLFHHHQPQQVSFPSHPKVRSRVALCNIAYTLPNMQNKVSLTYMTAMMSRTQELLTKIHIICVEIRDIRRTGQKQYIKTPFKGRDRGNPQTTDKCYSNPPHKEEEQDKTPDCSHTASTPSSPSSLPTDNSDTQTRCAGEEVSSPATISINTSLTISSP